MLLWKKCSFSANKKVLFIWQRGQFLKPKPADCSWIFSPLMQFCKCDIYIIYLPSNITVIEEFNLLHITHTDISKYVLLEEYFCSELCYEVVVGPQILNTFVIFVIYAKIRFVRRQVWSDRRIMRGDVDRTMERCSFSFDMWHY